MHLRNPGVRNKNDSGVIRNKGWSEGSGRGVGRELETQKHSRFCFQVSSCKCKITGPSLDAFRDLPPAFHTAGRADIQGWILELEQTPAGFGIT